MDQELNAAVFEHQSQARTFREHAARQEAKRTNHENRSGKCCQSQPRNGSWMDSRSLDAFHADQPVGADRLEEIPGP